jgi:hypothetical protein
LEQSVDIKLQAAHDAMAATNPDQKARLGASALAMVNPADYGDLFKDFLAGKTEREKPETAKTLAQELTRNVSDADKPDVAKAALAQLSEPQRRELAKAVLGTPSEKVRDSLWLIVIWTFVVVMLMATLVLAINVFRDKDPVHESRISAEVMLSLFTSVFGFLVGLFVPSPGSAKSGGSE